MEASPGTSLVTWSSSSSGSVYDFSGFGIVSPSAYVYVGSVNTAGRPSLRARGSHSSQKGCITRSQPSTLCSAFSNLCRYARCQVGKSTVPCSQKPPHQTAASVVPAPRKGSPW
jgi:hypothetical protein